MSISPVPICFCIDALARGGTELQLVGLLERLDRSAFAPHVCTIRPGSTSLIPEDCPHLFFDVPRLISPQGFRSLSNFRNWLLSNGVQVVHTFFQDSTIFGGVAARWARIPVRIAGFRDLGFWRGGPDEFLLRRIHPLMTGFVANSCVVRDHFVEADGLDPRRVSVIYNGVDPVSIPFRDHKGPTKGIGIVGNLNRPVKRLDLFLEAAGMIAGHHPDVRWFIIGDGPLKPALELRARELNLEDKVVFMGRVDDVTGVLGELQVGVNCSDSEGFSNAVLEYMFRGCAVVATDVGGNSEAVQGGRTGLLVPPGNAHALRAALLQLISDSELRRRLARAARRKAEESFSWSRCVHEHQDFYMNQLATRRVGK